MKIYFYREILDNQDIVNFNAHAARKHSLHQQYQYFIDILERLSEFSTDNPNDADYFCVPIFLAGWQFENCDPEMFSIISKSCKYLARGRHLLVGTGDFGQRYQSKYEMQSNPTRAYRDKYRWLDDRFIILALESTQDLHTQDIAFFPYLTGPIEELRGTVRTRDLLCSFKGALGYQELPPGHIRGQRLLAYASMLNSEGLHIYGPNVKEGMGTLPSRELMFRSTFTLAPAGYGQWSYRLMEALAAGSIPILMADSYVFPFKDQIDWDRYVLRLPEDSLSSLPQILSQIDSSRVARYQEAISQDSHLFSKKNCLDLLMETLSTRTRRPSAHWVTSRMRPPSEMGIICIDITNKCDLSCSNCTRLLENQDHLWEMGPDNFRRACQSLRDFPGVIAVIGGNPCMHSRFEEITRIFEEEIPNRNQRGIWTNNAFKHARLLESAYGAFNLNPHGVERGIRSLRPIYEKMVESGKFNGGYYDTASEHAPLLVASKDIFEPDILWSKISDCDVNKNWSAAIVQNGGKLRAYFCEVAASFDLARNQDHGLPVTDGWWKSRMDVFTRQIEHFCPGCGAPARVKGSFDFEEIDTYSTSNSDLALKAQVNKGRKVIPISAGSINRLGHKVTKYQANAQ